MDETKLDAEDLLRRLGLAIKEINARDEKIDALETALKEIIVRCHDCGGTQIWKRNNADEIEVYHDCFNGQHSRECFASQLAERESLQARLSAYEKPIKAIVERECRVISTSCYECGKSHVTDFFFGKYLCVECTMQEFASRTAKEGESKSKD